MGFWHELSVVTYRLRTASADLNTIEHRAHHKRLSATFEKMGFLLSGNPFVITSFRPLHVALDNEAVGMKRKLASLGFVRWRGFFDRKVAKSASVGRAGCDMRVRLH
jgi:hypothetical protein